MKRRREALRGNAVGLSAWQDLCTELDDATVSYILDQTSRSGLMVVFSTLQTSIRQGMSRERTPGRRAAALWGR